MIGKTLGHYTISTLIGRGGMGEVYKAKDQKLGRDVAIKVLPEEFAKDADRAARFQREAKLLASLNPMVLEALKEYASVLRKLGMDGKAKEVEERTNKIR